MIRVETISGPVFFDGQTAYEVVERHSSYVWEEWETGRQHKDSCHYAECGDPIAASDKLLAECREEWNAHLRAEERAAAARHMSEPVTIGGKTACRWQWAEGDGPGLRAPLAPEDAALIATEGWTVWEDRGFCYVRDPDLDYCPE